MNVEMLLQLREQLVNFGSSRYQHPIESGTRSRAASDASMKSLSGSDCKILS